MGIAPYVAVNFCFFDMVKKSLPEKFQNRPEALILTAFVAASIATLTCYPLDTVRRQLQMRGTPYKTIFDAFSAIVARDGVAGFIKLTTFDAMKRLISASEIDWYQEPKFPIKMFPNRSEGEELEYPFFEGDGSSSDE
ncbi:probable envelope ADP,ATP carrier protein, chloroplastic [Tanacetum coccineum]